VNIVTAMGTATAVMLEVMPLHIQYDE